MERKYKIKGGKEMNEHELNIPKSIKGDASVEIWFERFMGIGNEIDQISYQRQHKYGPDNIGMLGVKGLIPRIMDKTMRIKRAVWDEKESYDKDEKVVDAFGDLRNYAQFGIMLLRNQWYNKPDEIVDPVKNHLASDLAIDLDGTLAEADELFYTRFHIGKPIKGAKDSLVFFKNKGYNIVIHTARGHDEKQCIKDWMTKHDMPFDSIVTGKLPAKHYIDDRSIAFVDWEEIMKRKW